MIFNHIDDIYVFIDGVRGKLTGVTAVLTDEEMSRVTAASGWSVAMNVEHLAIVEGNIARIVEKLIGKAEANGAVCAKGGIFDPPLSLERAVNGVSGRKFEAPEAIKPSGADFAESIARLGASREKVHSLREKFSALDLNEYKFPHPFLGDLSAYEWLGFIGLHESRHLQQIERIVGELKSKNKAALP
jgi:hypothetical protein